MVRGVRESLGDDLEAARSRFAAFDTYPSSDLFVPARRGAENRVLFAHRLEGARGIRFGTAACRKAFEGMDLRTWREGREREAQHVRSEGRHEVGSPSWVRTSRALE